MDLKKKVEDCLNPEIGHKKRTFQNRKNISEAEEHLNKAQHNLLAMKINYDNHMYDWSIVIGYYAMFHAARALIYFKGYREKSHFVL